MATNETKRCSWEQVVETVQCQRNEGHEGECQFPAKGSPMTPETKDRLVKLVEAFKAFAAMKARDAADCVATDRERAVKLWAASDQQDEDANELASIVAQMDETPAPAPADFPRCHHCREVMPVSGLRRCAASSGRSDCVGDRVAAPADAPATEPRKCRKCRKCGISPSDPYCGVHCPVDHVGHDFVAAVPAPPVAEKSTCPDPRRCCEELTRVWAALGITEYTGKSAREHVSALRLRETEATRLLQIIVDKSRYSLPTMQGENPKLSQGMSCALCGGKGYDQATLRHAKDCLIAQLRAYLAKGTRS